MIQDNKKIYSIDLQVQNNVCVVVTWGELLNFPKDIILS